MDERYCNSRIVLQKQITISKKQIQQLIKHAKSCYPNESCALLFGTIKDENYRVLDVFLTENIEKSKVNFTVSNEELLEAYKIAEEKKLDVIGIFHSHPDSEAVPSTTDRKFMHSNPVIWLIYSGITDSFNAFYLEKLVEDVKINSLD